MDEIAKRAGVSRQALYLHFTDRTSLLLELTERLTGLPPEAPPGAATATHPRRAGRPGAARGSPVSRYISKPAGPRTVTAASSLTLAADTGTPGAAWTQATSSCTVRPDGGCPTYGKAYSGVLGPLRQLSASEPRSTASKPRMSSRSCTSFLAAGSSPDSGSAVRSGAPAGRNSSSTCLGPMLCNAFTTRAPARWRCTSSLEVSSSLSSSGILHPGFGA
ncbi:TetR/AcrR family transcriptional regulator [Nonomuraea gerenzanensis]|uniref:TetR/AcrR family transcriptional regulator n=1 Tax=Nonomuraea gerenzanensis TaxID=93944 RepID=UPI001CD96DF3|nr:TetR/AcrR family transcriptional regulator [Nonomuraea gerenzanensis]